MRIQHNIAALNSYRQLGTNNNAISRNLEKLSSGYRINRAGDDAAGLAISEKMRAQITGLETAQKNANDGISLVQTAEGALTEVHSMLNRMVELSTQASNGIYNTQDRANLQAEVDQLTSEIDRISESTNFNGINLLDGTLGSGVTKEAAEFTIDLAGISVTGTAAANDTFTIEIAGQTLTSGVALGTEKNATDIAGLFNTKTVSIGGETYTAAVNGTKLTLTSATAGKLDSTKVPTAGSVTIKNGTGTGVTINSGAANLVVTSKGKDEVTGLNGLKLQIGDTADDFNKISVAVNAMNSDTLNISGLDITTTEGADDAVSAFKAAIDQVSTVRGNLGAIQNRLEHTINNLGVTTENITAAESRIRDTDMAEEMMAYTKNNILVQASQAMLAQANGDVRLGPYRKGETLSDSEKGWRIAK